MTLAKKSLVLFSLGLLLSCQSPQPGKTGTTRPEIDKQAMASAVKEAFVHAWRGYKQYAWGFDALKPLSLEGRNWYDHSLLMTPLDGFDTMILMGLEEEAKEAKDLLINELSFDHDMSVQVFEVVIRMLGGLISAYELDGDPKFLELAEDLGRRLLPAFNSPTGMPYRYVNLVTGEISDPMNNPAEIGTLMLEFGTLSHLTGNPVYYRKAKDAFLAIYNRHSAIGLPGTIINVETGEWTNTVSHISARIDSYYEYMLKAAILFDDPDFRSAWETSIGAVNTYLADTSAGGLWYKQVDMNTGAEVSTHFGALDAFFPAVLTLGGDTGRADVLQDNCYRMWTDNRIEPEAMDYKSGEILAGYYVLRPENLESACYLYHKTGQEKYLEMGKVMFGSILEHCRTDAAFAAIKDITTMEKMDDMESFFLAETLKYAYLLFANPPGFDFNRIIFNTEAHPMNFKEHQK